MSLFDVEPTVVKRHGKEWTVEKSAHPYVACIRCRAATDAAINDAFHSGSLRTTHHGQHDEHWATVSRPSNPVVI